MSLTFRMAEGISVLLYGCVILGLILLFSEDFHDAYLKGRVKRELADRRRAPVKEGRLVSHLRLLLETVMKRPCQPQSFLILCGWIFLLILAAGLRQLNPWAALLLAALAGTAPYLLMRIRLESIRRKGSFEGEKLVSEFLRQYRISAFNVYETLERMVSASIEAKVCQKLMFRLLLELRNTGERERIRQATDRFAYGIHTNWSRMLAENIRLAAEKGTNVSLAVEDILIQLREAQTLAEERKRLNSEAQRITLILVPVLYLATVFLSVRYLELPVSRFVYNQVATPEGMTMLLAVGFLFILNVALLEVVSSQRFDF